MCTVFSKISCRCHEQIGNGSIDAMEMQSLNTKTRETKDGQRLWEIVGGAQWVNFQKHPPVAPATHQTRIYKFQQGKMAKERVKGSYTKNCDRLKNAKHIRSPLTY